MSVRVFMPCDSAALAVGADEVAQALQDQATARGLDLDVQRNSSRGLFWLEPLLEVETEQGRIAYGPVSPEDVASLLDADVLHGGTHPLCLGPTEQIPFLAQQQRLTFARMGITRPLSLEDYAAHGGFYNAGAAGAGAGGGGGFNPFNGSGYKDPFTTASAQHGAGASTRQQPYGRSSSTR